MTDRDDYSKKHEILARFFANASSFKNVRADGEPGGYAFSHNIIEILESCNRIVDLVRKIEANANKLEAEQTAHELREEIRHIYYHISDDDYLRVVI